MVDDFTMTHLSELYVVLVELLLHDLFEHSQGQNMRLFQRHLLIETFNEP